MLLKNRRGCFFQAVYSIPGKEGIPLLILFILLSRSLAETGPMVLVLESEVSKKDEIASPIVTRGVTSSFIIATRIAIFKTLHMMIVMSNCGISSSELKFRALPRQYSTCNCISYIGWPNGADPLTAHSKTKENEPKRAKSPKPPLIQVLPGG